MLTRTTTGPSVSSIECDISFSFYIQRKNSKLTFHRNEQCWGSASSQVNSFNIYLPVPFTPGGLIRASYFPLSNIRSKTAISFSWIFNFESFALIKIQRKQLQFEGKRSVLCTYNDTLQRDASISCAITCSVLRLSIFSQKRSPWVSTFSLISWLFCQTNGME